MSNNGKFTKHTARNGSNISNNSAIDICSTHIHHSNDNHNNNSIQTTATSISSDSATASDQEIGQALTLKLEFHDDDDNDSEQIQQQEEKEEKVSDLSFCKGLSKPPLAVPMMADTLQQSVTRNDAKQITESRLKRLKVLSQKAENSLSKPQKDEKKRIIRLEKNRRAAAMSRRKKKLYVKGLEDKNRLMQRHLAILEMENAHLRTLMMNHQNYPLAHPQFRLPIPNLPQFQIPNPSNCVSMNSTNTSTNTSTMMSSMEPNLGQGQAGANKRRRLHDGTSVNTTTSPSDHSSDIDILEPLPLANVTNNTNNINNMPPPPSMPVSFVPHLIPPNQASIHPSRLIPYSHQHQMAHQQHQYQAAYGQSNNIPIVPSLIPIEKVEGIVTEVTESKTEEMSDSGIPPEIGHGLNDISDGGFFDGDDMMNECQPMSEFEKETELMKSDKIYL